MEQAVQCPKAARQQLETLKALNAKAQAIGVRLAEMERYVRMAEFAEEEQRQRELIAQVQPFLQAATRFWSDPESVFYKGRS